MSGNAVESGRSVASKITSILLTFSEGTEHTLAEIARLTGLPMSTAHRLISELAALRLLERTADGTYRVGLPLRIIGATDANAPSIQERAPHVLDDLATVTKTRVRLGVLHDLSVAYIEKQPGKRPATEFTPTAMLPAHPTALGRALLAFSPVSVIDGVIANGLRPYTPHTTTDSERFRRALAVIRLTHVAIIAREFEIDAYSAAMPVFGPGGGVIAALELPFTDVGNDLPRILAALEIATRGLSRELSAPMAPIRRFTPIASTADLQLTALLNAFLHRPIAASARQ